MPEPTSRPPQSGRNARTEPPPEPLIPPRLPLSAPRHLRIRRGIVRLVQGLIVHNAGDAAPAMAFHFFLSLLPLLVLVGLVIAHFARNLGVDALLGPAIETAPDAVEKLVREELQRMSQPDAGSLAPLSVLGFLWLAATGTHGLMDAFEVAAGAPRRPWWKKRVIAIVWVAATLGVLGVMTWAVIGIDDEIQRATVVEQAPAASASTAPSARASSSRHLPATSAPRAERSPSSEGWQIPLIHRARRKLARERVVIALLLAFSSLTALAAFYRFAVEHPPGVDRRAWPGAIVAFTAWLVVSWGFGAYVTSLGRYALFYGSVATVAVLLVWLYLTSWALLIGAELNAQLEGLRDGPRRS
jgi:uncharacterized BrkB/YihY/UPF0761 family membrane protein